METDMKAWNWKLISYGIAGVLVLVLAAMQFHYIFGLGNGLSADSDAYSEANGVRAAEVFMDHGLLKTYGLPNITYGSSFPGVGSGALGDKLNIYTHYPPGQELILAALMKVFGRGQLNWYRVFPVVITLAALVVLFFSLSQLLPPLRALGVFFFIVVTPTLSRFMHGLSCESYSIAAYLLQLAFTFMYFASPKGFSRWKSWGLCLSGALQAAFVLDHVFLVPLSFVPFFLLWRKRLDESGVSVKQVVIQLGVIPMLGHVAVLGLHFVQVILYLGGVRPFIEDMGAAAKLRAVGAFEGKSVDLGTVVWRYLKDHIVDHFHFGHWFTLLLILWGALVVVYFVRKTQKKAVAGFVFRWADVAAAGAALLIPFFWIVPMKQHAIIHAFFLHRHFMVLHITLACIVFAQSLWGPNTTEMIEIKIF